MLVRVHLNSQPNNEPRRNDGSQPPPPPNGPDSSQAYVNLSRGSVPNDLSLTREFCAVVLWAGLLGLQQWQYRRDGWQHACDYQFKVWSTGIVAIYLLRNLYITVRLLMIAPPGHRNPGTAQLNRFDCFVVGLITLLEVAWFIWGLAILFLQDGVFDSSTCSKTAWAWSLVLWSIQAFIWTLPCLFVILLVPCVMIWLVFFRDSYQRATERTPDAIISKLRRTTFGELVAGGFETKPHGAGTGSASAAAAALRPLSGEGCGELATNSRSQSESPGATILGALPDVMGVTHLLNQFGSRGEAAAGASGLYDRNNMLPPSENVCAICYEIYNDHDIVIQLPCDTRHFFHDTCLTEWLMRNQNCPMCRRNIVDLVNEANLP